MTDRMIARVAAGDDLDDFWLVPRIVHGSRVLQERLMVGWEREASALTAVMAEATGAGEEDVIPAVVARTLWWTHRTIFRAAYIGLREGEDPRKLARRLRKDSVRAYDQVAAGLGAYGK
jgi:hypothetical protein